MTAANMSNPQSTTPLRADLLLVLFLIGFDVAARVLLHTGNVSPVAASALFAGMMLQRRWLALLVPLAAMALSDLFIGGDDWRIRVVVYAALTLPAVAGILMRRFGPARAVVPARRPRKASCSAVNTPALRAWASAVEPGSAPGLRTRISR